MRKTFAVMLQSMLDSLCAYVHVHVCVFLYFYDSMDDT